MIWRRWSSKQCDKTEMIEETKKVALVIEGLPPVTEGKVQEITEDLSGLVKKYWSTENRTIILNERRRKV